MRVIRCFPRTRTTRETARTVFARSYSKAAAECAAENLMAIESAAERHVENGIPLGEQHYGGDVQTEPLSELLGRLAQHFHKHPVKMEGRQLRPGGQSRQREITIRMRGCKCEKRLDARELASGHRFIVGRNFPGVLTILAANQLKRGRPAGRPIALISTERFP